MTTAEGGLFNSLDASFVSFCLFVCFECAAGHAEILVSTSGMEPVSPAVEAQSLNHWTYGEVHRWTFVVPCLMEAPPSC